MIAKGNPRRRRQTSPGIMMTGEQARLAEFVEARGLDDSAAIL